MRILAAHDEQGNIHHVVISPADAPLAKVTTTETDPGLLVTEVEVPKIISKLDLSDPEASSRQLEALQQLQEFRVEVKGRGKLVRKEPKGR